MTAQLIARQRRSNPSMSTFHGRIPLMRAAGPDVYDGLHVRGVRDGCSCRSKRGSHLAADTAPDVAHTHATENRDDRPVRRSLRVLHDRPPQLNERAAASPRVKLRQQVGGLLGTSCRVP